MKKDLNQDESYIITSAMKIMKKTFLNKELEEKLDELLNDNTISKELKDKAIDKMLDIDIDKTQKQIEIIKNAKN